MQRSLSGGFLTEDAALLNANVLVVSSAGNSRTNPCAGYYDPLTTFGKILVGSTSRSDEASSFSNYGPCVHMQVFETPRPCRPPCQSASDRRPHPLPHRAPPRMCAGPRLQHPGSMVGSSNTARAIASGTSMAAPHVSGVAAQLLAEDPTLSVARVKEVLLAAAEVGSIHLSANAVQGQTPNRLLIGGAGLRLFLNRPSPPPSPPMPPPSPPSPPSPPYCPVECGKPGHCTSEIAGFRDPNELHEVLFQRTPHALCVCSPRAPLPAATGAVLLQCQAFSSLGIPSEWLLCVGGVRCGLAVRTRQDICRGRGHLPIRRREALHGCRALGRLHRRHWLSVRL